jgi:cobalt ECF transporter T component CbiQ
MSSNGFIEHSLEGFVRFMGRALESEELARADGLLQCLDPRVKVIGLPALIVAAVASRRVTIILSIFAVGILLAITSRVSIRSLAVRVWIGVLGFTGILAIPAIFITPGAVVYRLPLLGLGMTAAGIRSATFLIARAETAATLSALLVLCTPWAHVLKALRALRAPVVLIVILGMTYRYIFLLLETAREMFESRRSRQVGRLRGIERRKMTAATAGALMGKTFQLSNDVYMAMQARGFVGEVRLLSEFKLRLNDYAGLVTLLGLCAAALWAGR